MEAHLVPIYAHSIYSISSKPNLYLTTEVHRLYLDAGLWIPIDFNPDPDPAFYPILIRIHSTKSLNPEPIQIKIPVSKDCTNVPLEPTIPTVEEATIPESDTIFVSKF
jgi:hypothetical protein